MPDRFTAKVLARFTGWAREAFESVIKNYPEPNILAKVQRIILGELRYVVARDSSVAGTWQVRRVLITLAKDYVECTAVFSYGPDNGAATYPVKLRYPIANGRVSV